MAVMAATRSFPLQAGWKRGDGVDALLEREWLVTNGLGGYASGTIGGVSTRRFHGKLIAALPSPRGRYMMLNHLEESLTTADGRSYEFNSDPDLLEEFFLENGLPVWRFSKDGLRIEKRVVMPYLQNTTYVIYRMFEGPSGATLQLRPSVRFRHHEGLLGGELPDNWRVRDMGREVEIGTGEELPPLRFLVCGEGRMNQDQRQERHHIYNIEKARGYDSEGPLWSPGVISIELEAGRNGGIVVSVEPWDVIRALGIDDCCKAEAQRRSKLLAIAGGVGQDNFPAQLVLAADQFLIRPGPRA